MNALRFFDFVLCAHEGTRRMRDTMSELDLPPPDFKQIGAGIVAPLVHVVLRNNVRQRRVWVDSDVNQILGEAAAKGLSDDEKRALNFVAEYSRIGVSDVQRLTQKSWLPHVAAVSSCKQTHYALYSSSDSLGCAGPRSPCCGL